MRKLLKRVMKESKAVALVLGIPLLAGIANVANAETNIIKNPGFGLKYKSIVKAMPYDEVIKNVSTPREAAFYRDKCLRYKNDMKNYGAKDYWASFKQIHEKGEDDCDGVAYAMAALLADDGYTPQVLWLKTVHSQHLIFPYQDKITGRWGCIGVGQVEDRCPRFKTIEEMVKTLKVGDLHLYQVDNSVYPNGLQNLDETYKGISWNKSDWNLKTSYLDSLSNAAKNADSSIVGGSNSNVEGKK